ncbi:MAG TPA: hypothetical protein DEG69_08270, partial [Flavobacteriaceae bacterium]|nr:hypothetical protein [Flavobacteriaceae bacterium]
VRKKTLKQTLGNFNKIYEEVMMTKNTELSIEEFDKLSVNTICCQRKSKYLNKKYFDKFRNHIFSIYKINDLTYDTNYPEVILVKRDWAAVGACLIDDEDLSKRVKKRPYGDSKRRRAIRDIDSVENYLKDKYTDKFKSVYFENIPFEEQVSYFNNAKLIICDYGAVMSNMFFCKEGATIIACYQPPGARSIPWVFFNQISNILNLNLIECQSLNANSVIDCINKEGVK